MAPVEPMMPVDIAADRPSFSSRRDSGGSVHSLSLMEASASSSRSIKRSGFRARIGLGGVARRTLGICLLMVTVCLWTASNFLASYIFSDDSFGKPFFVVYINTSIFAISLIPMVVRYGIQHGWSGLRTGAQDIWVELRHRGKVTRAAVDDLDETAGQRLLVDDEGVLENSNSGSAKDERLSFRDTAMLSLEFSMLWFLANYFASACLEYTSVGSVTIFTSLSSMFTLIFCALMKVESFSARKLIGVLASLLGVGLISSVDLSGQSDENRGNFPHKSQLQILLGDSMALLSAVIYGVYVTVMKSRVGNEDRVNMPLFFGLVGLINVLLLWPIFILLHVTGVETFELPPTGKIWTIIMLNSISSFFSDMSWAYAMLLTTPLVVTVGLSLTIPLSLIGEMIQYAQYSSWVYWVGAFVVLISFLFINHESQEDATEPKSQRNGDAGPRSANV